MKNKNKGIEMNRWGFFLTKSSYYGRNEIIATCIAATRFRAEHYFKEWDLVVDACSEVRILNQNKHDETSETHQGRG